MSQKLCIGDATLNGKTFSILIFFIIILGSISTTDARPAYIKNLAEFPDEVKLCTTCHIQSSGSGPLNPFGRDFAKNGRVITPELMNKDSDGDSFSNLEELKAGSNPGDAKKTPEKKKSPSPGISLIISSVVIAFILRWVKR